MQIARQDWLLKRRRVLLWYRLGRSWNILDIEDGLQIGDNGQLVPAPLTRHTATLQQWMGSRKQERPSLEREKQALFLGF